ncbi:unnamed protein product [Notodromas monacha]|uniref:Uncharacterized protein n=1 Tax=Notodromas monacha TaxID=399045 RepID=A0A7R9BW83_9CRUS|nr:unnamed protein product [Notodromas monacha]CAG0921554.1 unnamed protein product [Notodromas monacha]
MKKKEVRYRGQVIGDVVGVQMDPDCVESRSTFVTQTSVSIDLRHANFRTPTLKNRGCVELGQTSCTNYMD